MAVYMQTDNERLYRFLFDRRMESVWKYLLRHRLDKKSGEVIYTQRVNEAGFLHVPFVENLTEVGVFLRLPSNLIKTWKAEFSLQEQACAGLYLAAFEVAVAGDVPLTKKFLDEATMKFVQTVNNCRWLQSGDLFPPMPISTEVEKALQVIIQHCEDRQRFYSGDDNPRRLELSSGQRGDDVIRGHVRKLAATMKSLFGDVLVGQLTTIANVELAPSKPIDIKSVRNWTANLPPNQRSVSLVDS